MAKKMPNRIKLDKTLKKAGPNLQWPDMAAAGCSRVTRDANGNIAAPVDPTKTTVAWASVPPGIITFTFPNPADTTNAVGTNGATTAAQTGCTLTATFTNLDGSTPLPPATSPPFDVPAGPAVSVDIVIGTPTP